MRHAGFFGLKRKTTTKLIKKIHTCILYDCLRGQHTECMESFPTVTGGVTICLCSCHNLTNKRGNI